MTRHKTGAKPTSNALPFDESKYIQIGENDGLLRFDHGLMPVSTRLPLPGIMIFVHGVNSDGEWYDEAEQGLCDGLNERLHRRQQDPGRSAQEGIAMTPARYLDQLTRDGFINPKMKPKTFMQSDGYSPVIRFRWGYAANDTELQTYGDAIFLNEQNYWGGGPFANGCTSLPDLWGEGLSDQLFLWLQIQHLNPTNDRKVYTCPPRPYFVLAAYRLACLIQAIRQKQADVPITIVCHSQGNMVSMAAAFLGERLPKVSDAQGRSWPCIADNYVLCNPPYSVVEDNMADNWTASNLKAADGSSGRQTAAARFETLAAFFAMIGARRAQQWPAEKIDAAMSGSNHPFKAQQDLNQYGLQGATMGRVTLYCNPHDQVISSLTVQGMGWRGLCGPRKDKDGVPQRDRHGVVDPGEIARAGGQGVFTQRVFAEGYPVGKQGEYDYWANHCPALVAGSDDFWKPQSMLSRYSVAKGLEAQNNWLFKVLTVAFAPAFIIATSLMRKPINASPDARWKIPLEAPDLPEPFLPKAKLFGQIESGFDMGLDPHGWQRDKETVRAKGDPFFGDISIPRGGLHGEQQRTDAARGDAHSEASLQYEYHAALRMAAKRDGMVANNEHVTQEDKPETATADYTAWRNQKIQGMLASNVGTYATDHSTIMTNSEHAQKALAYDVAVGCCYLRDEDLRELRTMADWRFLDDFDGKKNMNLNLFIEYFSEGKINKLTPLKS
ncbi:DUF3274 domain-containing protein [Janthinobacterium sp. PC23-8]|uniref:T6SS effector phospholipase Tle3 domain-containing protein n=1 Tax=Janthinobacterium sp. PC23-8 TaxID=2012679 RepID=UPI000B979FBA|nr:DUF3274 domain-containing protein [Janthinobacterium sp. PC23-8]OYO29869.1 hypothetical protein CD932_00970 [Janthinobacterium sp. PC23-8]